MSVNHREPKPEVRKVDFSAPGFAGSSDSRFKKVVTEAPAKILHNDAHGSDMNLLKLYTHGELKWQDTGKVCNSCVHFQNDPKIGIAGVGRCKARGFLKVHKDTPAVDKKSWTDPVSGYAISPWIGCPLYTEKSRLSRR
jgi:hypothetical protein